jgi:hypothetical protein
MAEYTGSPSNDEGEEIDIVEKVWECRKRASKHQADWRANAREEFDFLAGSQWDANDRALLEEQGRPVVVFNRVAPIIKSVVGLEMNNRQRIQYKPRTFDDASINEMYTETARFVRGQCDAEDEESDAFRDAVTVGMGWIHGRVDYEEEADGQIVFERVPPLEMRWDPQARKANLVDARWLMREKRMLLSEVRERWPNAQDITPSPQPIDDDEIGEHDATDAWKYENDQGWIAERLGDNRVSVIHYQWREREEYYRVGDTEAGRIVELDARRFSRLRERVEAMGTPYVRQHRWRYRQAFICGQTILEEGDAPINGFSYRPITGERDEADGTWYGLMRAMIDPQRWANKWLSQAMHILNANAKGGVIAETSAVEDARAFEENWSQPDGVIWVEDGAIAGNRILQKDLGGYPSALDKLLAFAISSVRDCVGVNLEMLGMADREQAQVLEMERKKAALVILAPLMNSLRRYRRIHGKDLLDFMRTYMPAGTVVRVTGDQNEQQVMRFKKDDESVKYDVIVDTAPDSPSLKDDVWRHLAELMPSLIKAGVPMPPDLIRFSPLPSHVAEQWIKYIEKQSSGPSPEIQQQMEKLNQELEKLRTENNDLKTKAQVRMMETQMRYQDKDKDRGFESMHRNADRAVKLVDIAQQADNDTGDAEQREKDRMASLVREMMRLGAAEKDQVLKAIELDDKFDIEQMRSQSSSTNGGG